MNDADYLANVIKTYAHLDKLMPHFRIIITDQYGVTLFCSKLYQATRELDDLSVGHSAIPEDEGKYRSEIAIAEWQKVIETREAQHAINIHWFEGVVQPYLTSKYPIINEETGNIVAMFNIRQKVLYNSIQHQLLRALEIYDESKNIEFEKFKLTKREKQLIFLFLSGLSSKEIAIVLSKIDGKEVSKNTIDNIFTNQLRIKFNAFSREALYEKLLRLGFDRLVPKDLLVNVKIPLLSLTTY